MLSRCLFLESPIWRLSRAATDLDVDLIVLASHGRSGISHLLLGSVAEKVVRLAPCPVFTVKLPLPAVAAGCLICLWKEGQVVEATASDWLPSPVTPTVACWTLARGLSLLTWQEVKYELSNLSLVLREHLRSCGCVACAATDQRMAISSGSVEPSGRALVGWRRSRRRSVSLGLSSVSSRIGRRLLSEPVLLRLGGKLRKSVAERAQERQLHLGGTRAPRAFASRVA